MEHEHDHEGHACGHCGKDVGSRPLDMGFDLPDELFRLCLEDPDAFQRRALTSEDVCRLDDDRFFLRGLLDVPIHGSSRAFSYGVWFEVSKSEIQKVGLAWNDPVAYMALRVSGRLANALIHDRRPSVGALVELQAFDPGKRMKATTCDSPWIMELMVRGWSEAGYAAAVATMLPPGSR